ncbi:hypothetical protein F5Y18DRAFT_424852 [Xylariaceae sp. FL1019]|nr:hypothetical protein F5Y18DRAFT_424852 [Xylariaceae sp. FL1019]
MSVPSELTPWATRFPTQLESDERPVWALTLDGWQHSGLAYEYPLKDPKFYNDESEPEPGDNPMVGDDLIQFFTSEHLQEEALNGLTTAQVTSLSRWAWHSQTAGLISGGHVPIQAKGGRNQKKLQAEARKIVDEIFQSERLTVDESSWFPFFQKERWYDPDEEESYPYFDDGHWSVDNPQLWDVISLSTELANRMLNALIDDGKNILETILFGRIDYWRNFEELGGRPPEDDSLVLLSSAMEGRASQPASETRMPVGKQYIRARLGECTQNTWWSFMGTRDLHVEPAAETVVNGAQTHRFIVINISPVDLLMNKDLTLAERCHLHFFLAQTMVHELMHAIIFQRMANTKDPWNKLEMEDRKRIDELIEPFIDFDHLAEIGAASESRIFDGRVPSNQTGYNVIPLAHSGEVWPFPTATGFLNQSHDIFRDGSTLTIEHFAAIQTARLLTEDFWTGGVAPKRKSDNNWHRYPIFSSSSTISKAPRYGGRPPVWGSVTVDRSVIKNWQAGDAESVRAWHQRRRYLELCRRGWYVEEKALWISTPWSYPARHLSQLDIFRKALTTKDEAVGALAAEQLTTLLPWKDEVQFRNGLPTQNSLRNHDWIFFVLGILMYAVMPIRTKGTDTQAEDPEELFISLVPRKGTAHGGPKRFERASEDFNAPPDYRKANPFFDPFNNGQEHNPPSHEHYLDLADRILIGIKNTRGLVSRPWYNEILQVARDVREDRQQLREKHPDSHQSKWSSAWSFEIPRYEDRGQFWMQWSEEDDDWVRFGDLPAGATVA